VNDQTTTPTTELEYVIHAKVNDRPPTHSQYQ
jgi:hypothetical protein